ncbi:MAG: hypothetical protein AB1798_21005 [Spirochaetota bacterium]
MEDQLDLFQFKGVPFTQKILLNMSDGLFYISNGSSLKIMKFNSYGDILTLFYNPEKNPIPIGLSRSMEEGEVSNKQAYPYPFRYVGEIAVTPEKELLVQDQVQEERQEYDKELDALLDNIVLRFDRKGGLVDYLGQEGIGGTPFPYIQRLQVTSSGEIVVITRTMRSWLIFWYSRKGSLLYKINIFYDNLPQPEAKDLLASLETIIADNAKRLLYLKLDYYRNVSDQATGSQSQVSTDFYKSGIYILNIETEKYEKYVEIPKNYKEPDTLELDSEKRELLYEFIGEADNSYFFLLSPDEDNLYQLIILNKKGKVVERTNIQLKNTELLYRYFYLTPSGILSALLCEDQEAEVAWWRSDKLLEKARNEDR